MDNGGGASVEIYTENVYVHVAWVYGIMSVKHVFLGGAKQVEKNYLGPYQRWGEALSKQHVVRSSGS